jgi:hypothetical protein
MDKGIIGMHTYYLDEDVHVGTQQDGIHSSRGMHIVDTVNYVQLRTCTDS